MVIFYTYYYFMYKAIYQLAVLRVMPVCNKMKRKKVHMWRIFLHPVQNMTIYLSSSQKKNISLLDQLTIALYYKYLPIVLCNTTKYNFIPFNRYMYDDQTDFFCKILLCRTGHFHGIAPKKMWLSIGTTPLSSVVRWNHVQVFHQIWDLSLDKSTSYCLLSTWTT